MGKRKYSLERRRAIVKDYLTWHTSGQADGRSANDIARQHDISKQTLYTWVREDEAERHERARVERMDRQIRSLVDWQESDTVLGPWEMSTAIRALGMQLEELLELIESIRQDLRTPLIITRPSLDSP